jgi:endoglucanase
MRTDFVQISGENFTVNGEPMILRGWALGSWMNLEHFMMGLPGTNSMIQEAFADVYGKENSELFFDDFLDQFVKEEDIVYLKSIGTNSIRIPFGYHYFIDDQNPDVFLERGFRILDKVIRLCMKHQMYVILDLHSVPGSQNTDWHSDNITGQALFWRYRCFQDQVVTFWKELASRYADNPWIAGYDVINEPGYGLAKKVFNEFYDRVIGAIREVDKDHIIFLEGDDFGRSFELFDEPADPQATYVVHFYPFVLEDNILDPQLEEAKRIEIFESIFYRQLRVRERFRRPIWCGESGYELLEGQQEFYSKLLRYNIGLCEDNNLSWSLWTYKDAGSMGIAVPGKDSLWMKMRREIEKTWSHEWEQKVSMKIMREVGEKYYQPLEASLLYDLDFRMRSIMHRIAVEQILKPKLRQIPLEEIREYPKSFAYENCEFRDTIVKDIKKFISERIR